MTYIVSRQDGRHEIRESVSTPRGPRSRTLATFRRLTDEVLDHAESRALTRFDRDAVRQRAEARRVPVDPPNTVLAVRRILEDLIHDRPLPAGLVGALRQELDRHGPVDLPDTFAPATEWLGVSAAARGDALRDLLRMTDRLPMRKRPDPPTFPRIRSASA